MNSGEARDDVEVQTSQEATPSENSEPPVATKAQPSLSLEQMAAIRRYMLTLVAIPGALLAVISALTGYVIGQHEDTALTQEVTKVALPIITEAARQTGISNGEAKSAAVQVAAILEDAKAKSATITSSIQQLTDAVGKSQAEAKANFSTFAKELVADQGFRDALGTAYKSDISTFKQNIAKWGPELKLSQYSIALSGPPGGSKNVTSICPDGAFLVGIETSSNTAPPFCIGCLVNLKAVCRPLNTQ